MSFDGRTAIRPLTPVQTEISPLAPTATEIVLLAGLVVFYLVCEEFFGRDVDAVVNVVGPIAFTAIMGLSAWAMLKADSRTLYTPLLTYRVSSAVYFGLGQMVHLVVSPERVEILESLYAYDASEVARMNLLVAVCSLLVALMSRFFISIFSEGQWSAARTGGLEFTPRSAEVLRNYGLAMLVIGSMLKYVVVLPINMGWLPAGDVPGFLVTAAEMSLIGINLLTIWTLCFAPRYFPAIIAVVGVEIGFGALLFSKVQVLLPLLMVATGVMVQKVTWLRVALVLAAVAFIIEFMQPLAGYARNEFAARTNNDPRQATLRTRIDVLQSYFDPGRPRQAYEDSGEGLLRIAYVNAGTLAMAMYDRGSPGDSYRNILVALVPRILWPDKPLLQEGGEFSSMATGRSMDNSVSPGLFSEAYWNFGWLGVPIIAILLSLFIVVMSRYSLWVLGDQRWMFFPIALIGMKVGLSIDGMFVGLISGTTAIIIALHYLTTVVERVFDRRETINPAAAAQRMHIFRSPRQ